MGESGNMAVNDINQIKLIPLDLTLIPVQEEDLQLPGILKGFQRKNLPKIDLVRINEFFFNNQELTLPSSRTVENFTSRFEIFPHQGTKFPDSVTVLRDLVNSGKDGITFEHQLTEIYHSSKYITHQLEVNNQFGHLIDNRIFHVPRFYDVLTDVVVDLNLPDKYVACSTVLLDGTILGQSQHNKLTTILVNVTQSQTVFARLMVDVKIYSTTPVYKHFDVSVITKDIIFNHSWIRELFDKVFVPIPTEVSLFKELSRLVYIPEPPPLMVNGWSFSMPYTLFPNKNLITVYHGPNALQKHNKSQIVEEELNDLELIFPSGEIVTF